MLELCLFMWKAYWKSIVGFLLGVFFTAFIGHGIYDARSQKHKTQKADAVAEANVTCENARVALVKRIQTQQTQTEDLNRENNDKMADLERRAADAKRLYKATGPCVGVIVRPASTPSSGNTGNVPAGYVQQGNGVDASELIDYYALAERIRTSQDTCRRQMDAIYQANQQ